MERPRHSATDAAITARQHAIHVLEQALQQSDPNDILELVNEVKHKLAQRYYAINAQQSFLLKLPAELIVEIANLVLQPRKPGLNGKRWFTALLPLLQTCTKLRTELRPLRSEKLVCWIDVSNFAAIWPEVMRTAKEWRCKGAHEGQITFVVAIQSLYSTHPHPLSTLAAMAGALECALYGRLLEKPTVYIGCWQMSYDDETKYRHYYVSHGRETNMVAESFMTMFPIMYLSDTEGAKRWADKRLRGEA